MQVGDLRLLNIRVIQDKKIIYEGLIENASNEIKKMNTIGKCTFDYNFLVLNRKDRLVICLFYLIICL